MIVENHSVVRVEPPAFFFAERFGGQGAGFGVAGLLAAERGALKSFAEVHDWMGQSGMRKGISPPAPPDSCVWRVTEW
jgi:hypothetical protein